MDDLVESILDYIRSDYTDYAIMINGEWGSGKTYFWDHKIKPKTAFCFFWRLPTFGVAIKRSDFSRQCTLAVWFFFSIKKEQYIT